MFGIGGGDGEGADRSGGLVVEDGVPGAAVVGGLPDAAIADTDVEDVGLGGNSLGGLVRPARKGPMERQRISANILLSYVGAKAKEWEATRAPTRSAAVRFMDVPSEILEV